MKLASRSGALYTYEGNSAAREPTSRTAESDSGNTVFTHRLRDCQLFTHRVRVRNAKNILRFARATVDQPAALLLHYSLPTHPTPPSGRNTRCTREIILEGPRTLRCRTGKIVCPAQGSRGRTPPQRLSTQARTFARVAHTNARAHTPHSDLRYGHVHVPA